MIIVGDKSPAEGPCREGSTIAMTVTDPRETRVDERLVVISSDCHAGPARMHDFRPYVERRDLEQFDAFCAAIDEYDSQKGAGAKGGGAPSHNDDSGLWDADKRRSYLNADGIAGEVIFPQGTVPFAPYPAFVFDRPSMAFGVDVDVRNRGTQIYNRWLAALCELEPERHAGVAVIP